jgi:pyruvate dehydrogenase E2 component (dihydrolipoamide acetyltransferase)
MFDIKFADIGEGIHEGVIYKIVVNIGDTVKDGDTLYLVETDKVTAEIPSPVEGVVKAINFSVGDTINVGDTIIVVDDGSGGQVQSPEEAVEVKHEPVEEQGSTSVVGDLEISSEVIASSQEVENQTPVKKKILATPVARKLAKDLGVDIQKVKGSGPAGRVMKADIRAAVEPVQSEPVSQPVRSQVTEDIEIIKMSQMRKAIAEQMTLSKFTIPHTAVMDEVDVDELVDYRQEVKLLARQQNIKLTYLPFFIKAVVLALKAHPFMNASLEGDNILLKKNIHIGIAVDTPHGLMVPVIRNADHLSILELAKAIDDLNARAQTKSLKLEEIHGSTFSITNYGAFGSSFGVPVINYPEAGILGVGKITKKPVVLDDEIEIRNILPLSMSFDHRIVDGADAGRFMNTIKDLLSNPQLLLLS